MALDNLNCRKATLLATKRDDEGLGMKERLQLWYHYRLCYVCKIWEDQSRLLDKILRENFSSSLKSGKLSEAEKKNIKTTLADIPNGDQ